MDVSPAVLPSLPSAETQKEQSRCIAVPLMNENKGNLLTPEYFQDIFKMVLKKDAGACTDITADVVPKYHDADSSLTVS